MDYLTHTEVWMRCSLNCSCQINRLLAHYISQKSVWFALLKSELRLNCPSYDSLFSITSNKKWPKQSLNKKERGEIWTSKHTHRYKQTNKIRKYVPQTHLWTKQHWNGPAVCRTQAGAWLTCAEEVPVAGGGGALGVSGTGGCAGGSGQEGGVRLVCTSGTGPPPTHSCRGTPSTQQPFLWKGHSSKNNQPKSCSDRASLSSLFSPSIHTHPIPCQSLNRDSPEWWSRDRRFKSPCVRLYG